MRPGQPGLGRSAWALLQRRYTPAALTHCGPPVKAFLWARFTSAPRQSRLGLSGTTWRRDFMSHRSTTRRALTALAAVAALSFAAACGGDNSSDSGASASASASHGPITYVQGKDNSGVWAPHDREVERGPPEREGHAQGAVRQRRPAARRPRPALPGQGRRATTSSRVDVVWTAGVRRQGLAAAARRTSSRSTPRKLLKPTVTAAHLQRHAVRRPASPATAACSTTARTSSRRRRRPGRDVGHVRHRRRRTASDCFAGQFAKYEGLTV